jgi:hypothetical protein
MIIHRPHRGGLNEAMKETRQFTSLGECINTLIQEHNNSHPFFKLSESDIYLIPYGLNGDDRIGWKDTFMICCAPYDLVKDRRGYELYYGGKYNHPLQLFGFISTDFT